MEIGVLALQGDFALHEERLRRLGASTRQVRKVSDLSGVHGIVLPGGESTTLLKLLDEPLRDAIKAAALQMPVLATCAGAIVAAKEVQGRAQESLALLDIRVARNAYGRQLDSFIDDKVRWTERGEALLAQLPAGRRRGTAPIEGVFIRAPRITRVGKDVDVLLERGGEAVLVRQGMILAATFHPELSDDGIAVHELFLAGAR